MDPLLSLAVSMQASKGTFALLLGSGVSRSAGIPTDWEIVLDLIRKVAMLENFSAEPEPAAWYRQRYLKEPKYWELIGILGKSPAERRNILRGYFEPTEEEQERGEKVPARAHRAIAELVKAGYVRVILTTNFDRLLELALQEVGITPSVIATADAADGIAPLVHQTCTIVKLHGDYLDSRIRNTEEELSAYPRSINRLLDRILDEYGLIVCGWSAEWDAALRAAIERCRNHRFTTYWAVRSPNRISALNQRLIDLRRAEIIPIGNADSFFQKLAESVTSLEEINRPHPLSAKVAETTLKRYIVEDRSRIRLHDLVSEEVKRAYSLILQPENLVFATLHEEPSEERMTQRLAYYEAVSETLRALLATGCFWGGEQHHKLWQNSLERLATFPTHDGPFHEVWINLRRYPALFALYSGGIAAIAAERYDTLAALLTHTHVRSDDAQMQPLVFVVNAHDVFKINEAKVLLPKFKEHYLPFNDYLFSNAALWGSVRELLLVEERFTECFDRFEYLLGLAHMDLRLEQGGNAWAPLGCFVWRYRHQEKKLFDRIAEEIDAQGSAWPPLQAGLFGGSFRRLQRAKKAYDNQVAGTRFW